MPELRRWWFSGEVEVIGEGWLVCLFAAVKAQLAGILFGGICKLELCESKRENGLHTSLCCNVQSFGGCMYMRELPR